MSTSSSGNGSGRRPLPDVSQLNDAYAREYAREKLLRERERLAEGFHQLGQEGCTIEDVDKLIRRIRASQAKGPDPIRRITK